MTGADAIVAARVARWPLAGVDVLIDARQPVMPEPIEQRDDLLHGVLRVAGTEGVAGLDFRCCHRLPVFVHAPDFASGMRLLMRIAEFQPATLSMVCPTGVIHFDGQETHEWAL